MRKRRSILAVLLALAMLLSGCSILPKEIQRRTAPILRETEQEEFEVSFVTRGDMALTTRISCTYVPKQKINLNFALSGEWIDEIFVEPGDTVKKGQVLGQLDLKGVEESIEDLNFRIETVKMNISHLEEDRQLALERQRILYAADAEKLEAAVEDTNKAYDNTRSSYEDELYIMQMQLNVLYESKKERQMISPIDGTVTYVRKYAESALSDEKERAITVVDATLSLFSARTEYWDRFKVGDLYQITCRKVVYEAVVADPAALGIPEEERIPGERAMVYFTLVTPNMDLEDNDRGALELVLESRTDVLRVNRDAVSAANGETIVYIADEEGMKTYKKVTLGLKAGKYYEVLDGLAEGEEVIVE